MVIAWSTVLPFTHSVTSELEAMAEPHPNVLNLASWMTPESSILSCRRITSPQAGAPTRPVPTLGSFLVQRPDVPGVLVVVDDLVAVSHEDSFRIF